MKTEEIALSRLVENEDNPRQITEENFAKLVKSIVVFPKMLDIRPVVTDGAYKVLGGNMRTRALAAIQKMDATEIREKLDEDGRFTEGEKIAITEYWMDWKEKPTVKVVKADDLTEAQNREFIIKDNAGFGEWDVDKLANEWDDVPLTEWGVPDWMNTPEGDDGDGDDENNYERKIVPPVYEPSDEDVRPSEVYDKEKAEKLIADIEAADMDEEMREFLKVAAYRHVRFNYRSIADLYAKAAPEVQRMMEDSALVIVDKDKAIELGFIKISKDFLEQYGKENPEQKEGEDEE